MFPGLEEVVLRVGEEGHKGEMVEGHSYELFVCSNSVGSIYFIVGTTFKLVTQAGIAPAVRFLAIGHLG